jgi:hypothetical protein
LHTYKVYKVYYGTRQIKRDRNGRGAERNWKSASAIQVEIAEKNHDAIVQFDKQAYILFRKYCIQSTEVIRLNDHDSTEEIGFTNFVDTVKAGKNEELWLELHSHRNHKQLYDISAKMQKR